MTEITPGVVGDYKLEVAPYTDGVEPTVWTAVRGMTEFTPGQIEKNQEDDSSFDSDGWASVFSTGLSWKAEGTVKLPRASLTPDAGQEILRAAGSNYAEDGFVHVRISDKTAPTKAATGIADVTFTKNGGPRTDLQTAAFALAGRGALEDVTITP